MDEDPCTLLTRKYRRLATSLRLRASPTLVARGVQVDVKPSIYINAEGGPLLLVDAHAATSWRGALDESKDYETLCAKFDANRDLEGFATVIDAQKSVAWEMVGGGTAFLFQLGGGQLRLIRAWMDEDTMEELEQLALVDAAQCVAIGDIDVPSGLLAVLWAQESGEPVPHDISGEFESVAGTAMDNSTVVLRVAHHHYRCWHDTVSINTSSARRLTLIPV